MEMNNKTNKQKYHDKPRLKITENNLFIGHLNAELYRLLFKSSEQYCLKMYEAGYRKFVLEKTKLTNT